MRTPIWKEEKKKKFKVTIKYIPEKDEPFYWTLNGVDEYQEVFGNTVCTQHDSPCKGVTKSWIVPTKLVEKIEEIN